MSNVTGKVVGDSLPWVEKYRPRDLHDLIAHEQIINTLNRLIDSGKLPHLLLYGPAGTGKTSTILAAARRLYGPKYAGMILELNASDDRGIDVVRDQIKEFAGTKKLFSTGAKLVILDEADAMTQDAQFALRRVIEKYTQNTRFCLICNYVSKIIPALQSRCTRFRFSPLSEIQVRGRVEDIIKKEGATVTEEGLQAVLRLGKGDMRRILNILQAAVSAYPVVDEEKVYACTGDPLPRDIAGMTAEKGYALSDLLTAISGQIMQMRLPPAVYMQILKELSDIEYALSLGASDQMQTGAIVGIFAVARDSMASTDLAT